MGARDQIGFWGAIQHFIRENIQTTFLGMREILESLFREHGNTDPPGGPQSLALGLQNHKN